MNRQTSMRIVLCMDDVLSIHGDQKRKGTKIPYVAHLFAVTSLVMEDGGNEDEVIAALLHDAVEDSDLPNLLDHIRDKYGGRVAEIVEGCSDTDEQPKPPWHERKQAYLDHLRDDADDGVLRVSAADKLHNARSILADLTYEGADAWNRFNAPWADQLWYYNSLCGVFALRRPRDRMTEEFIRTVAKINELAFTYA